ncbi:MAG: hypothetical protein MRERV_4c071 [Mycoplasmataceae bacterium RV_VA103A]|nr:MAG: hypothetical protein MRERV_11c029 [Mycoplasmataceae bacterium RV_VA103A]KLL05167.1 MAG: hypothetical protein MRERV_4c071 [Mycoplasmataceae bacterium RV_VA103A]
MTKEQLQQEIKEKVKPGVKPSQLKRSKSADNITSPVIKLEARIEELKKENTNLKKENTELKKSQEEQEIFVDAPEENTEELKTKISQLQDQILELRISKIKEFGEYHEKRQELEKDLASNINYGTQEIQKLETKLRTVNKQKWELQQKLGQSHSEKARLEIKLIEEQNKETKNNSSPNKWIEYGPIILFLILYFSAIWLSKNTQHE